MVMFPGFGTILYLPGDTIPDAYVDRCKLFTLSLQKEKSRFSNKRHQNKPQFKDWRTIRETDLPAHLRSASMAANPSRDVHAVNSTTTPTMNDGPIATSAAVLDADGAVSESQALTNPSPATPSSRPSLATSSSGTSVVRGPETPKFDFQSPSGEVPLIHREAYHNDLSRVPHPSHGGTLIPPDQYTSNPTIATSDPVPVLGSPQLEANLRPSLKRSRSEMSFTPRKRSHLSESMTAHEPTSPPPPPQQDTQDEEANDDTHAQELGDVYDDPYSLPAVEYHNSNGDSSTASDTEDYQDESDDSVCSPDSPPTTVQATTPPALLQPMTPFSGCSSDNTMFTSHPFAHAEEASCEDDAASFFAEPDLRAEAQDYNDGLTLVAIISALTAVNPDSVSALASSIDAKVLSATASTPVLTLGPGCTDPSNTPASASTPAFDLVASTSNPDTAASTPPSTLEHVSEPTSTSVSADVSAAATEYPPEPTVASGSAPAPTEAAPTEFESGLPLPRVLTFFDFINDDMSKD